MSATPNRLSTGRPGDLIKTKISDLVLERDLSSTRSFYLGQVINSTDPKNASRLRVRIPLLDDVFYTDDNGKVREGIGDDKLPWAISAKNHMIDTPENGSVVLVVLLDPQKPSTGRIWFTAIADLGTVDPFDVSRLVEETDGNTAWTNAENNMEVKFDSTPGIRNKPRIQSQNKTTNYKVGIKGKDKNKVLLDQAKTTVVQNEGTSNESKIELTENIVATARELKLQSSQSSIDYHPVFDRTLWQYMQLQLSLIQAIVTVLTTSPGQDSVPAPCTPSPSAASLVGLLTNVQTQLTQLQTNGASQHITIN